MNKEDRSLIDLLIRELQYRNYSPRTVVSYSQIMVNLTKKIDIPLATITTQQFKDYLHGRIFSEGISTSLVNQSISAFKILQVDILKHNWEEVKLKRPRKIKRLPVVLSINEIESLISVTPNIKHKAILMLTYSAGLRKQELLTIRPNAIDSKRMQVRVVQGKGKKDRYTILSSKTLDVLRQYYLYERPHYYLFEPLGRKGRHLSGTTLDNILQKSAMKAGITKDISFHTLRHCFATHLLENGVNLKLIQQFLGHASMKTTTVYLHLANINPRSVSSPLDSMNLLGKDHGKQ